MITIDFETRSRYSIKGGASRYSLEADVLCLAYQIDDAPVKLWTPDDPDPQDLLDAIATGAPIWAFNVSFEMAIWQNVMVAKHGWPPIPVEQWRCTLAESMAVGLPGSLENVGKALGIESESLKDKDGHRVMLKLSKPRKPTKHNKAEWHSKPEDFQKLYDYCKQDVVAEVAIHHRVPRLNARELSVFHYDKRVNARGVKIDRVLAECVEYLRAEHANRIEPELAKLTEGRVKKSSEVAKIIEELRTYGIDTDTLDQDAVADLLKSTTDPVAKRILEIRQELALSSLDKYTAMLLSAEDDDRMRGTTQYHGAQTGRWAGRIIQPQNMPRGFFTEYDYEYEVIDHLISIIKKRNYQLFMEAISLFGWSFAKTMSSLVRSAIIAEEGKKFIIVDFASVEARGVAWSANEKWLLTALSKQECSYKHMAADIYSVKYDNVTKAQRFTGKQAILGCGYGLGAKKFQTMCAKYNVELELEFCQSVINAYRGKNHCTKKFWYELETAAVNTVATGKAHSAGPYTYWIDGKWLKCRLPAGRDIAYYRPVLVPGKYGKQIEYLGTDISGKPVKTTTWGGKLLENAVQGICRDLLADAMSRLEKRGYTVVLHVHDEIICEVDEGFGSVEEMEAIMCEVPSWADGFPISAEGFESKRYRK